MKILILILPFLFFQEVKLHKVSLHMEAKTLKNGKYVVASGDVYYRVMGGEMVTHFTSPFHYLVYANALGEQKMYDFDSNSIMLNQDKDLSSKNSFFYYFLNNRINDMGLESNGFVLVDTKFEDEMVITDWEPSESIPSGITKAQLVSENYYPIYMGFYNEKGEALQKIYYSNYTQISKTKIPLNITEISFTSPSDSTITRKTYTDLKINEQVTNEWLEYKIPENAKVVSK